MHITGPVNFPDEPVATLSSSDAKLVLAALLRVSETPEFTNGYTDSTLGALRLAVFGPDGVHVTPDDANRLLHEAYAEWRRG